MDKKRGVLNISASVASRILLLFIALFIRRLLIQNIGNDVNGLNSLYTSIIGLLSVAELGVGSAIVFSMYRPIVDGDDRTVGALFCLYKKLYRIIGAVIFIAGSVVMPFLPRLINDYESIGVNVYITFFLTLVSVTLSYLYSAKTSLIEAHKNNYITTGIATISRLLRYILQIAAILIWKSYTVYLTCQVIETVVIWVMTERTVRRMYPEIICMNEKLNDDTSREVEKNIKAMFMHKIGAVLVGAIDSLVISAFIGVVILGKYSNYTVLAGVVSSIIALFFTPLTSVIGHMCAVSPKEDIKRYFGYFYSINYILGVVFFMGYYAVIDDAVTLFFGKGLDLPEAVAYLISLNQFIGYLRYAQLTFRDAAGVFYYDRWKPLVSSMSNLGLSILLVKILPQDYALAGVIIATIITWMLICDTVEPYILYRHVFRQSPAGFICRNYVYIVLFAAGLLIMDGVRLSFERVWVELIFNGMISLGVSGGLLLLTGLIDRRFRENGRTFMEQLRHGMSRGKGAERKGNAKR